MQGRKLVYLGGRINAAYDDEEPNDETLAQSETFVTNLGYIPLNPTRIDQITKEVTFEKYMKICYGLIDIADTIFMVSGWQKSKGANAELTYAKSIGKKVMYQDYYAPFRKVGESDEDSTKL